MRVFSSGILRSTITQWVKHALLVLLLTGLTGCGKSPDVKKAVNQGNKTITPQGIENSLEAADKNLQSGQFSKAEAILSMLVEKVPDNIDARGMYGEVLFQQGAKLQLQSLVEEAKSLYKKSYQQYKAATEVRPNVAGLHHSAGQMAGMAGLPESALLHYVAAEKLEPNVVKYPLFQSQIHLAADRLDEALDAVERALKLDSTEPFALATLANIQMKNGEIEKSLKTITKAIDYAGPDEALAMRISAAKLYRLADQIGRSIQLLAPLDDQSRANVSVTAELAASWKAMGDRGKAIEAWRHRFQVSKDWRAAIEAAKLCLESGKFEEARFWKKQAEVVSAPVEKIKALLEEIRIAEDGVGGGG